MTVNMKALKEAGGLVERLRDGASGLRAAFDLPDGMSLQEATLMHEAASTILSLIERCEELEGALEPNGDTKAAYMGEFSFNIETVGVDDDGEPVDCTRKVYVPWTTIKEIMAAIRTRALSKADATS